MADFGRLSNVYDGIAGLVFGRRIFTSQYHFLKQLPAGKRILLFGGGTGRILPAISDVCQPSEIVYIDESSTMCRKAASRAKENTVIHQGNERDISLFGHFDVVLLPFVLDAMTPQQVNIIAQQLHHVIATDGEVHLTDFDIRHTNKGWRKWLIQLAIWFFRQTAGYEFDQLRNYTSELERENWKVMEEHHAFHKMIRAVRLIRK